MRVLSRLEELFNRRDFDAYLELLDPDIEWHVAREDPDATVHRGREQVRAYLEDWIDAFADLRIDMEETSEADDRILAVIRFTGHGSGSGMPLDDRVSFVFSLRDRRVAKVEDLGRDQASTK